MNNSDIPGDIGGDHALGPWLNKLKRAVMRRTPLASVGIDIKESNAGFNLFTKGKGGGSGRIACYRVKSVAANHLVCHTWDGTTEGAENINVAKPHSARQPVSESLGGTTYNYTYAAGPDAPNSIRTSSDGSTTESQIVTPLWTVDGLIQVAETNFSGVAVSSLDLKLIELSARCWAKIE